MKHGIEKVKKSHHNWNGNNFAVWLLYPFSLFLFFFLLFNARLAIIHTVSLYARYKPHIAFPLFAILLFSCLNIKNFRFRHVTAFFLVVMVFALTLRGIWASERTEQYLISGLIPFSDARFQFSGSLKLLETGELNGTTSRRPISAILIALFFALSQYNLQLTLALMTLIAAIMTWYALLEVDEKFGQLPAILFLFLCVLFFGKFAGTPLTENLGYSVGVLSLAFLVRSIPEKANIFEQKEMPFLIGVFLFSLAQNVRPGSIITIPLLVIFAGVLFKAEDALFNWKAFIKAFAAAALPFLINVLHFQMAGMEGALPMSNMGYGLYGFTSGGKLWSQVYADNPQFLQLSIADKNSYLFSGIFKNLIQHPEHILTGYGKEFRVFFSRGDQSGFLSTIHFDYPIPNHVFSIVVLILLVIGIIAALINVKKRSSQFILAVILGYVFSVPFAASYQVILMRIFAASMPFFYLIPAYGLSQGLNRFRKHPTNQRMENDPDKRRFYPSYALIAIIIFSPVLLLPFIDKDLAAPNACPPGSQEDILFYHPRSALLILEDDDAAPAKNTPFTHQYKFHVEIGNICCVNELAFFRSLKAPLAMFSSIDSDNDFNYVIVDPTLLPEKPGWIQMCGVTTNMQGVKDKKGFFYPEYVTPFE